GGQGKRKNSDRDIDKENPAPGVIVRNPAAKGRTKGGSCDHRNAVDGKSHATFRRRERIRQDGLLARLQATSSGALKHAKDNQNGEVWGQAAKQRADREDGNTGHIKTFASDDGRTPAAERQDDGIGNQVRSKNPRTLVGSRGKATRDVWQGYVGDTGI